MRFQIVSPGAAITFPFDEPERERAAEAQSKPQTSQLCDSVALRACATTGPEFLNVRKRNRSDIAFAQGTKDDGVRHDTVDLPDARVRSQQRTQHADPGPGREWRVKLLGLCVACNHYQQDQNGRREP
jgi:hypothetical protein